MLSLSLSLSIPVDEDCSANGPSDDRIVYVKQASPYAPAYLFCIDDLLESLYLYTRAGMLVSEHPKSLPPPVDLLSTYFSFFSFIFSVTIIFAQDI